VALAGDVSARYWRGFDERPARHLRATMTYDGDDDKRRARPRGGSGWLRADNVHVDGDVVGHGRVRFTLWPWVGRKTSAGEARSTRKTPPPHLLVTPTAVTSSMGVTNQNSPAGPGPDLSTTPSRVPRRDLAEGSEALQPDVGVVPGLSTKRVGSEGGARGRPAWG